MLFHRLLIGGLAALLLGAGLAAPVAAQDVPPQRQIRTYIPPDQLVSFLPSTPLDQFIEFLNPIVGRVTGKQVVEPEGITDPIGIAVNGMYFLDALELVLQYNGLTYRETDRFYLVEPGLDENAVAEGEAALAAAAPAAVEVPLATLATREIQIDAILFNLDLTEARETGIDWNVFFGEEQGGGSGGNGGGFGDEQSTRPTFFVRTEELFDDIDDVIIGPDVIEASELTRLFRLLERDGLGETVANPTVTVQSGEEGSIQIGSDIPIQTRDFAGNTITQFQRTGIIIDVVPTLIREAVVDTAGAPEVEFVHLNVSVQNSSGRPSEAGVVIDRNQATTQVLLLPGEQTIIGGLYSTSESLSRRGIPVLKDLPSWFFGLRYVFGYTQESLTQNELLIVLRARLLDPLRERAERPVEFDVLQRRRLEIERNLREFDEDVYEETVKPRPISSE